MSKPVILTLDYAPTSFAPSSEICWSSTGWSTGSPEPIRAKRPRQNVASLYQPRISRSR
jgi:hypothetical protein